MKKLSNYLKDNETITLVELYKRVYGESGSYLAWCSFEYEVVQNDNSVVIIPETENSPVLVKKRKTFFKKVLDKVKHL